MASKKFLFDIDLGGNKIFQMVLEGLDKNPETTSGGRIYFNTEQQRIMYYTGTGWQSLTTSSDLAAVVEIIDADMRSVKTRVATLENGHTNLSSSLTACENRIVEIQDDILEHDLAISGVPAKIDSRIKAGLHCSYNSSNKTIKLSYTDSKGGIAVLGDIDASIFVRDSMVKDVDLVVNPGKGLDSITYPAGTYILFTFNVPNADGEKYIYLNVTSLIDVYTAGSGISMSGKAIAVKIAPDSTEYIAVSSAGLSVKKLYDMVHSWNKDRVDEINTLKETSKSALRTHKVNVTSGNTKVVTIPGSTEIKDVACFLGNVKVECAVAFDPTNKNVVTISWNGIVSTDVPLVIYVFYNLKS